MLSPRHHIICCPVWQVSNLRQGGSGQSLNHVDPERRSQTRTVSRKDPVPTAACLEIKLLYVEPVGAEEGERLHIFAYK